MTANHSIKRTCLRQAAYVKRVCRAWHRTIGVKVSEPGKGGAEGKEKGKGVIARWALEGSPIQKRGARYTNRI